MSVAALEAGIAFNNASVTLIHGMSRPIGALFHVPHGISNAMLMKECLGFALSGTYERFAILAREINVAGKNDSGVVTPVSVSDSGFIRQERKFNNAANA